MLEQELKLSVEGSFTPSFPAEGSDVAGMEELPALDLRATYFDTPDLRLARGGVTLRCRVGEEGERPAWTVKLPVGAGIAEGRDELEFEGGTQRVPEQAQELVQAMVRHETLVPVARLRTRRRRWILRGSDGGELAELVDDRVAVLERGQVVERFRELEVEARQIEREGLERLAGVLEQDGVTRGEQTPKLVRALGARAEAPPEIPDVTPPGPRDPAGEAVRAAIAAGLRRMVMNDPRTRLGEVEPLHQMRVGTRRLRSDLRTFRPLLDREWAQSLRDELKWLGGSLGAVRDLDVQIERLRDEGRDLGPRIDALLEDLERRRDEARAALRADLRSERYLQLLERLMDAARAPRLGDRAADPARDVLPPLAARSWRKLRKAGRRIDDQSSDEDMHRVRVLTKRARYAAEAVAPSLGRRRGRAATKYAKRASNLQDVLGELQDSVVAGETIEEFALAHRHKGPLNLASGQMLERESHRRRTARERYRRAWGRLDRKKRRAWLK